MELVGEIGHATLHLEGIVGTPIHFIPGRSSKANDQRIKVIQDGRILPEDGAMHLIHDHEVKPSHGELLAIRVNVVNHRLVSGEHQPRLHIRFLVLAQYAGGSTRQELDEVLVRLIDKGGPVSQEEDILGPAVSHQHIAQ